MNTISIAVVLLAIFLPAAWYIYLAYGMRKELHSLAQFFPLTKFVKGEEYGRSTAAAGVSLATVILALVNLAPFLGIGLLVTVGSYVAGFVLLYFCVPTILRANPDNDTIQAFLGRAYRSKSVTKVAVLFSFLGYTSIFSMELLVGVTVLEPFMGENVLAFSFLYLLFIVGYSVLGGFKAIVATEQWQIRFVVAAVLAMLAAIPMVASASPTAIDLSGITQKVLTSWAAPLTFTIGIIAMNLPAAISDSGSWQRLCATRSEEDAKRGIRKAIPLFILIWGTLILGACFVAQMAISTGMFDPAKVSLMTFVVSTLAGSGFVHMTVLFVFMLGLFAAMITTADSLLLVAAQMFAVDIMRLPSSEGSELAKVRKARIVLAAIAIISFILFAVFRAIKFDVVQLIFSIYGANLALFPAVAAALFFAHKFDLSRSANAAIVSVLAGFSSAWASAIYGKVSGSMDWMYNAPVVALVASCLSFGLLVALQSRRRRQQ